MPSRWEAFGLVAIEAMKYGKPVIASDRGALPELVKDGVNGYVFAFETPNQLTEILAAADSAGFKAIGAYNVMEFREKYQDQLFKKRVYHLYW